MGILSANELIEKIRGRAAIQRDPVGVNVTDTCLDAINNAQREIVMAIPGLVAMQARAIVALGSNDYSFALTQLNYGVAHVGAVTILKDRLSRRLPFRSIAKFDTAFPVISAEPSAIPVCYTRRADIIELNCIPIDGYRTIRVDYTRWPAILKLNDNSASQLSDADEGLILAGQAALYLVLGEKTKYMTAQAGFQQWVSDYKDYNALQTESDGEDY